MYTHHMACVICLCICTMVFSLDLCYREMGCSEGWILSNILTLSSLLITFHSQVMLTLTFILTVPFRLSSLEPSTHVQRSPLHQISSNKRRLSAASCHSNTRCSSTVPTTTFTMPTPTLQAVSKPVRQPLLPLLLVLRVLLLWGETRPIPSNPNLPCTSS